ncbi:SGNH/GDSL hydrolase family protein [Spirosoma sordidisoli]|uniref:SGNH/GDSL hydrolase family protein n=1 Tax=Spirosoma sordidisoli TaxID=2502893 RepID=A0A4Q2UMW8_9BACT|nr:hypothetical protein [Spirosoma sordidisoli]RYC70656.1 hypothetical protein EQG79_00455 [Spirosoma sordidisoli]
MARYQWLNTNADASVDDPTNVVITLLPNESKEQAAARKSANNAGVSTSSFIPSPFPWLKGLQMTYTSARSMDLEIAPEGTVDIRVKIRRQDNINLLMRSSGGQVLSPNSYYPPGPRSRGDFKQEWSYRATGEAGSGIGTETLEITIARFVNNAPVETATLLLAPRRANLTTIFGPYIPGSGNATAGTSTGTSGTGTATATATGTGSGSPAFVYETVNGNWTENSTQVMQPYGIPVRGILRQESGDLRIELREGFGSAMQIYRRVNGQWLSTINMRDQGRLEGACPYAGPLNFAADQGNTWSSIGYNPLAGSVNNQSGPVVAKGITSTGWLYTKTRFISWPHNNTLLMPLFVERWVKIDGNRIRVKLRLTHFRDTVEAGSLRDATLYEAREQETPFSMIWPATVAKFYNGQQPFTNAPATSTNGVGWTMSSFPLSEPWAAVELPEGKMLGMVSVDMYNANVNFTNLDVNEASAENSDRFMYIGGRPMSHLDPNQTFYYSYDYIYGSESEIRAAAYALPRTPLPDFSFVKSRAGWVGLDGVQDQKEPFTTDNWKPTYVGKTETIAGNTVTHASTTALHSPFGSWRAADFDTLFIRTKYAGGPTKMGIEFLKVGQKASGFDPNNAGSLTQYPLGIRQYATQIVWFNLIPDNQFHTYEINMRSNPNWSGIISRFELVNDRENGFVTPGQAFEWTYFGAFNPDMATGTLPVGNGVYNKVLIVGNSITNHPAIPDWGGGTKAWGMDASAANKDYVHILTNYLRSKNPNVQVCQLGDFPPLTINDGSYFEGNYWQLQGGLERYNPATAFGADAIVIRLAENVTNLSQDFTGWYKAFINKLRQSRPNAAVFLTTSLWESLTPAQVQVSNMIRSVANDLSLPVIDLSGIPGSTDGYANHPTDPVHQTIADRLWAAMSVTSGTGTPTPTATSTGTGTGSTGGNSGTGTGTPTYAPPPVTTNFDYPILTTNQNVWPITDTRPYERIGGIVGRKIRISNGFIMVGFWERSGGAVCEVYDLKGPEPTKNIVNNADNGGRQLQSAYYRGGRTSPNPNAEFSFWATPLGKLDPEGGGTGNDPITAGDAFWNPSPILAVAWDENRLYIKSQLVNWPVRNEVTDVILERWFVLVPGKAACRVYERMINNRTDDKGIYDAYGQEMPCVYANEEFQHAVYYEGGQPYANQPITRTNSQSEQIPFAITEPWIARVNNNNRGVGVAGPGLYEVTRKRQCPDCGDGEFAEASPYVAWQPQLHIDWNQVLYNEYHILTGHVDEMRQYAMEQNWPRTLATNFAYSLDRGRWIRNKATDGGVPFPQSGWTIVPTLKQASISSQRLSLPASSIGSVFIRMAYAGPLNKFRLLFWRHDMSPYGLPIFVEFPVNSDGQMRTIEVPLSGNGEWRGVVNKVSFQRYIDFGTERQDDPAPAGELWRVEWINTANVAPPAGINPNQNA